MPGDRAIAKARLFFDQRFDRHDELFVQLGSRLCGRVVDRAAPDIEPGAQFRHRHHNLIVKKALLHAADHLPSSFAIVLEPMAQMDHPASPSVRR